MKRLFCLLLSALAVLSICPMGIGEEAPQGCISLNLESNPSTGYQWEFQSTDEAVASVQALGTTVQQTPLLGAPAMASFQVCGVGAGAAEVRFSYRRSWEEEAPLVSFTLPVTVDGEGNVAAGSEIILFREPDTGWGFEMRDGTILEIEDQGGEEENQAFVLHPLAEGQEEITFTLFSGEGQLPGVLTCRVNSTGDSLAVYEVEYRSAQEDTAFAPDITFTTTDLEGNTVTEQVLAGHSLTIRDLFQQALAGDHAGKELVQRRIRIAQHRGRIDNGGVNMLHLDGMDVPQRDAPLWEELARRGLHDIDAAQLTDVPPARDDRADLVGALLHHAGRYRRHERTGQRRG